MSHTVPDYSLLKKDDDTLRRPCDCYTSWDKVKKKCITFKSGAKRYIYHMGDTLMQILCLSKGWIQIWLIVQLWLAERKPGTSCKYSIWVRGNFIRTGCFPATFRLLHQGVAGGLHCIILDYEAWLCYYKDAKLQLTGRSVKYRNTLLWTA